MKKNIIFVVFGVIVTACATLQEVEVSECKEAREENVLMTKSEILDNPIDSLQMLSRIQSSHVMTLIRSIVKEEGVYVQSLTKSDLDTLGINETAFEFVEGYIQTLNGMKYE